MFVSQLRRRMLIEDVLLILVLNETVEFRFFFFFLRGLRRRILFIRVFFFFFFILRSTFHEKLDDQFYTRTCISNFCFINSFERGRREARYFTITIFHVLGVNKFKKIHTKTVLRIRILFPRYKLQKNDKNFMYKFIEEKKNWKIFKIKNSTYLHKRSRREYKIVQHCTTFLLKL